VGLDGPALVVEEVVGEGAVDEDGARCAGGGFPGKEGLDVEGGEGPGEHPQGGGHASGGQGASAYFRVD
jgi:hypothetical protein